MGAAVRIAQVKVCAIVNNGFGKAYLRAQPKTSTGWGGLKRFRDQGAFLKSPLVAPAGAKYPSRLKAKASLT